MPWPIIQSKSLDQQRPRYKLSLLCSLCTTSEVVQLSYSRIFQGPLQASVRLIASILDPSRCSFARKGCGFRERIVRWRANEWCCFTHHGALDKSNTTHVGAAPHSWHTRRVKLLQALALKRACRILRILYATHHRHGRITECVGLFLICMTLTPTKLSLRSRWSSDEQTALDIG